MWAGVDAGRRGRLCGRRPVTVADEERLGLFSLYARTPIWIDVVDPTSPHSLSCPSPLRVRKGENGASLQAEIRALSPFSNSANLSHLGFCENTACESLIVLALGPWTPSFWAPSWRFLPIQARQSAMRPHCGVFCRPLLLSAFAETSD